MLTTLKRHAVRFALGLALLGVFLVHATGAYRFPFIDQVEALAYDYRVRVTLKGDEDHPDDRIVILDIDEKSLGQEGRWPWPRNRLARLLDKLFDQYGVEVLGFDVVFAERDESSGLKVMEQLAQGPLKADETFRSTLEKVRPELDHDQLFAQAINGRNVILGYYLSSSEGGRQAERAGVLPEPVMPAGTFAGRGVRFTTWDGYGANLPELQAQAIGAGHFNPLPDPDGISRRVPMLAEYEGAYYESLSLAIVRLLAGLPKVEPGYPPESPWTRGYTGLEWLEVGPIRVPVDENVAALIPFRGKQRSFRYIPVTDVLQDQVDPAMLKNKIVLVGTSAPGLLDLRATPVEGVYPGVEIHANLIAGMLDHSIKQRPPYVVGAEVVLLSAVGLALVFLMPLLSPVQATLSTVVVLAGVVGLNVIVWEYGNLVLPLASGVLMILLIFALNMSYGYFVESRKQRQMADLFGQYVVPELVQEMSNDPESYSMEGQSREMTVLFSDVRGFTSISESLDPKALTALMNEYLTPMTQIIRNQYRGTLDKYIGDAIMAFWGAPIADPQHARNAVLAGLDMLKALEGISEKFKARGWPPIRIGVGINTGNMVVGDMGSAVRKSYTVMGDAVNLGSRLEGITKEYGVGCVASEFTRKQVPDVVFLELDKVRVKGKDEPVAIYEPMGVEGEVPKAVLDEIALFHQAVKLYRSQNWDMAELQLFNLQKMSPERRLYQVYLERIAHYRKNPPAPDWDGVWVFEHK